MPDTKPLAILKAAATQAAQASVTTAAGSAVTKPTGLTVTREQARPKAGTVIVVRAAPDEAAGYDTDSAAFARVAGTFAFDLVCMASGDPPEDAVDELVRWAHASVMNGRTMGGVVKAVFPVGVDYSQMRANDNESAAVVRFRAIYHTAADDPTQGY